MFTTLSNDRDGNSKIRKDEHNYARISDNTIENRSNKYIEIFAMLHNEISNMGLQGTGRIISFSTHSRIIYLPYWAYPKNKQ